VLDTAVRPGEVADLECYLAELYVVPGRRGQGLGRALMEAAIELARREGATHMDLGASEDDVAARALYERLGFSNREAGPTGRSTTSTSEGYRAAAQASGSAARPAGSTPSARAASTHASDSALTRRLPHPSSRPKAAATGITDSAVHS
jgi:predicted N-acetyltransferase YhbS